jgi:hypothetical protein
MDELQARWEKAWATKEELSMEQERLIEHFGGMEPAVADRALDVLIAKREELERELKSIQATWQELGGDNDGPTR